MARGTGTTTNQMRNAPKGAYFVWVNHQLHYPKKLAEAIGREDLKIVSPSFLENDQWRGLHFPGIVADHAANLSERGHDALAYIRAVLVPREKCDAD